MSLVDITLHPVFMPISRLDTCHLFFLLVAQLSLCSQVGLGELHYECPHLYLGIISIVMKIIVVSIQLTPLCFLVYILSDHVSVRVVMVVIILRGKCLMHLFMLIEDWVETGDHNVVRVLSTLLEERSLVFL